MFCVKQKQVVACLVRNVFGEIFVMLCCIVQDDFHFPGAAYQQLGLSALRVTNTAKFCWGLAT